MKSHSHSYTQSPPIAIIGGGFSGTLTALQLAKRLPDTRIVILESATEAGPGLAYQSGASDQLLNVPAGRMSAFVDQPDHFLSYASRMLGREVDRSEFLQRSLYGRYLKDLLRQALERHPHLEVRKASVVDLVADVSNRDHATLTLQDGSSLVVARAILAVGNHGSAFQRSLWASHCLSARDPRTFDGIDAEASVVIIGTALSMIDAVGELQRRGHRGPIHATSRHGLVPRVYEPPTDVPVPELDLIPDSDLRRSVRLFRKALSAHEAAGGNWRDLFAALRPSTPSLWQELSERDRSRFLRFISPFWEVHRHQCAPETHATIERLVTDGRLTLHRGTLVSVEKKGEAWQLEFAAHSVAKPDRILSADRIIDATGPARDVHTFRHPLVCNLLRRGFIMADAHRLGVQTLPDYRPLQRNGLPAPWLHIVGPLLRARYFEATSVPELRLHTEALAARIAKEVQQSQGVPTRAAVA